MQTLKIGFQENTHVGLKRKANEDSHGHKNIPGCGHVFVVCEYLKLQQVLAHDYLTLFPQTV